MNVRLRRRLAAGAVAGVLGAVALTGCESDPAAAAVVGGSSIRLSTLTSTTTEALVDQQFAGSSGGRAAASRSILGRLITQRLIDELAARMGVSVSPAQVARERAQLEAAVSAQEGVSLATYYGAAGVPASQVDSVVRSIALEGKIAARLTLSPARQQAALQAALLRTARTTRVSVNPRFGRWQPTQLQVTGPTNDVSKPAPQRSK